MSQDGVSQLRAFGSNELGQLGEITEDYIMCEGTDNPADAGTKSLNSEKLMRPPPARKGTVPSLAIGVPSMCVVKVGLT